VGKIRPTTKRLRNRLIEKLFILDEPTDGIQDTGMFLSIAGIIAPNIGLIRKKRLIDQSMVPANAGEHGTAKGP